MADILWLGTAPAITQVDRFTPATVEIDDVFTLTATAEDGSTTAAVSFTATVATVANVTAGLVAAWNASTDPLCTGVTASDGTTYMELSADVTGVPFYVEATTTDGGGADTQTLTKANQTANSGPNDWNTAANWSGGVVPGGAAGHLIYFENNSVSCLYGMDQSSAPNALVSLNFAQTYTGLLSTGAAGEYLKIKTSYLNIGYHAGTGNPAGSSRLKINTGPTVGSVAITVDNSGPSSNGQMPIQIITDASGDSYTINKGKIAIAPDYSDSGAYGTINVGHRGNINTDVELHIGSGLIGTALNTYGGSVVCESIPATINVYAGNLRTEGSDSVTTINIKKNAGNVILNGTGTITTLDIDGGVVDTTQNTDARTITTLTLDSPGVFKYNPAHITLTNKVNSSNIVSLTAS